MIFRRVRPTLTASAAFAALFIGTCAWGHGGGLDSSGGHHNSKTGDYHCHRDSCKSDRPLSKQSQAATDTNKYNRADWAHWSDLDGNGINTRHEVLIAEADGPIVMSADGRYVVSGLWEGMYSGKLFRLASDLDIDHIVPIHYAHTRGGADWPDSMKEQFANDPLNLIAVDDGLNQSKGARGPTEWLPPNHAYRCEYLYRWQSVLNRYSRLHMESAEERIFNRQLEACGAK